MRCPKCSGQMEINRIRTLLVWVDEPDRIPDSKNQLGTTVAHVCRECGYIDFYRDMTSVN